MQELLAPDPEVGGLEWMAGGRCQARRCGEVEGRAQAGEEYWADGRWRFEEDRQH